MENKFFEIVKGKTDADLLEMVYDFDRWDAEMLASCRFATGEEKFTAG